MLGSCERRCNVCKILGVNQAGNNELIIKANKVSKHMICCKGKSRYPEADLFLSWAISLHTQYELFFTRKKEVEPVVVEIPKED